MVVLAAFFFAAEAKAAEIPPLPATKVPPASVWEGVSEMLNVKAVEFQVLGNSVLLKFEASVNQ